MEELALAVGRQAEAVRLGDGPVHVPLDVRDRRARRGPRTARRTRWSTTSGRDMSRTSCWRLSVRGRPGTPIAQSGCASNSRLRCADHLGLDPEAEPDAQRLDLARRAPSRPFGQLAPVDEPVAERRVVRVALAEPAVVEHEQLDAEVARRGRDLDQLRLVEVEVGRLPVVDEDRPRPVAPRPAGEPLAVQAVERVAHRRRARRPSRRGSPRASGTTAPGSSVQAKVFGLMPIRTRVVSNGSTSASARKLPE